MGPPDVWDRVRAESYRSMLVVGLMARDQQLGLSFLSKGHRAFQQRAGCRDGGAPHRRSRRARGIARAAGRDRASGRGGPTRAERLEARVSRCPTSSRDGRHGRMVGQSAEWHGVLKKATQVARPIRRCCSSGESGTGKEVVARFIHRASARKARPVRRAELRRAPEQLLESELFGYERGRVHRRAAGEAGPDRAGRGRRAVPRRSQRDEPRRRRPSFCASCRSGNSSGSAGRAR